MYQHNLSFVYPSVLRGSFLAEVEVEIFSRGSFQKHTQWLNRVCLLTICKYLHFKNIPDSKIEYGFARYHGPKKTIPDS